MKYQITRDIVAMEATEQRPFKIHSSLYEFVNLFKQTYPNETKVRLQLIFHSVSKITWCPLITKGLISKTTEVADKMRIPFDTYVGLVQMVYDLHVCHPSRVFNIIEVDIDANKMGFEFYTAYDKGIDSASGFVNGVAKKGLADINPASAFDKKIATGFSRDKLV